MTPAARLRSWLSRWKIEKRAMPAGLTDDMRAAIAELDRLTALAEARVQPVAGGPQAATAPPWQYLLDRTRD